MNTCISLLRPGFLLPATLCGLLLIVGGARAQSLSSPLEPTLADSREGGTTAPTEPRPSRSRLPEAPVGMARSASAAVEGAEVTAVVVTGITGVEQRLWVPDGMALYDASVEVRDSNNDGVPEVTASGVREGRIGLCTWNYRPALERYSSRAQVNFDIEPEESTTDDSE